MSKQKLLVVEGVSKRYQAFDALREVSFFLENGEILGLLGRNGAGKSTLIKILCNLVRPTLGQAWLAGEPILAGKSARHRAFIGAVIEAPRFYPQLSGRANLSMIARLRKISHSRVREMLEQVGLQDRAAIPFGQYSMGMKQRLGLAAAFLHSPKLVILDEPTSGLDPVGQTRIRSLIRELTVAHGAGALLCSHLLEEVGELCGRALVMEKGSLILERKLDGAQGMAGLRACFAELAEGDRALGKLEGAQ